MQSSSRPTKPPQTPLAQEGGMNPLQQYSEQLHPVVSPSSPRENQQLQSNLDLAIATISLLKAELGTVNATCEQLRFDMDRMQASETSAIKMAESAARAVDILQEQVRAQSQPSEYPIGYHMRALEEKAEV
jgi:hypothetical protein